MLGLSLQPQALLANITRVETIDSHLTERFGSYATCTNDQVKGEYLMSATNSKGDPSEV